MSDEMPDLDLHAYLDGELPPERIAAIEYRLLTDASLTQHLASLRAQKAAWGLVSHDLLSLPVPARLSRAARHAPATGVRGRPAWRTGLAGVALAASVAALVLLRGGSSADALVAQAVTARAGGMHPVRQVEFTAGHSASEGDRIIAGALGGGVHAPDLGRVGFSLAAAEIFQRSGGLAIQLRYVDRGGRLFTVFVRPGPGPDRFALAERHGTRFCVWQNEDASVVMGGAMPIPELFRLSSIVYTALDL